MPKSPKAHRETDADFDIVDVASEQSFPASDPPAWAVGQLRDEPLADAPPLTRTSPSRADRDRGHAQSDQTSRSATEPPTPRP